ncbi:MAG: hypothetical protein K5675_07490 [Lachnospiraceae bacterium]|nr:hypothetical protein [Lachnospiraceae bacterium]
MSDRTEQQRKNAMKERRERRNRIIRRRRMVFFGTIVIFILVVVLVIVAIVKNVSGNMVSTNTLTITDKAVTFEEISSTEDLSKSEVKDYAKSVISEFNTDAGETLVKLEKVKEKKDVVYVKTSYDSVDAYSDFSGYEAFNGTIEEA